MTSTKGVLFDVDGTLVDTSYQHTVAWWLAFRDAGLELPMRDIHRAIGMGDDQLLPYFLGREDMDVKTAHSNYYAPFLEQVQTFESAGDLLRACKERGLVVVLASSAGADAMTRLQRAIGADDAIDHVTTSGDVERSKPAPDLMEVALDKASLKPDDAVMVGDTKWDVESAAKAGLRCVAVMTGGWSAEELKAAGAVEVWASPAELLANLDASIIGSLAQG
jgi:HAD superfamily hydrolase (TIGR01549 family)